MRAIEDILKYSEEKHLTLPEAILAMDEEFSGVPEGEIRTKIFSRLKDMARSVSESEGNEAPCKFLPITGEPLRGYAERTSGGLCGQFILDASAKALEVATYNSTMGRIVAAPTAGSCGILPGLLFAWKELRADEYEDIERRLVDALIIAGAIGEVIANRATLAGADGGCQAECGAAAAMGAGSLVFLEGGTKEMVADAVALTIKSVLGLVCDPVGGLVEIPCIKRNGMLVALGALAADMALAGIKSAIPVDEVIDTMSRVGRAIPPSLRETSQGGLATTPTAKKLVGALKKRSIFEDQE
ncbi:MAG: L-serine ammonia-lyase, iron-sulfur-dependent, subunit alpha [Synergistaceae bacterium]|nr:L-serine ammonia-lyase, iron-sulfur-dependent, subunit alpha [Synergistaceae bacterium]